MTVRSRPVLVALLLFAAVTGHLPAAAAPAVPPQPAAVTSAADEASAMRAARAGGADVEVLSARTETATVYATTRGTLRLEQNLRPVRVRRGAEWVAPDPTLHRGADGRVAPVAAAVPMTFSGGGTAPMAVLGSGPKSVSLGWTAPLPVPVLDGPSATYAEVLPGVDLRVTADVDGLTHVLVVKNRAAAANPALRRVSFPMTTGGLGMKTGAPGTVIATDASGAEVLRGTAAMWDTPTNRNSVPAQSRTSTVGLEVAGGALTLVPDPAMLTRDDLTFPLYLDPAWQTTGIGRNSWMAVFSAQGGPLYNQPIAASDNSTKGEVKIGKTPAEGWVARALFQFDTTGIRYKHVNRAYLRIRQLWSSSWCGDTVTRRTMLHGTGAYGTTTTWHSQPGWLGAQGYSDDKRFVTSSSCPAGDVEFNATGFIQEAANGGWAHATMGLKAANESDTSSWKRYQLSTLAMVVEYNSYPNMPDDVSIENQPCSTGTRYSNVARPLIKARLTDPDAGAIMTGSMHFAPVGTALNSTDLVSQGGITSGNYVVARTSRDLADGTYYVQGHASDEVDGSQWTAACEFVQDTTKPSGPSAVTSDIYLPGDLRDGVGRVGTFTFSPPADSPDITGYKWALTPYTDVSSAEPVTAGADRKAVVPIVPMRDGANELRVWSHDRAGNVSTTPFIYRFNVGPGSAPAGRWAFDDTTAPWADTTGHGNAMVKQGDATVAAGRSGQSFEGTGAVGGHAATTGQLVGRTADNLPAPVRTDRSFSAAAWVRLDRTGQFQTFLGIDGTRTSAFFLQSTPDRWSFALSTSDVDTPAQVRLTSAAAPVTGRWTHLAGVYDATGKKISFYVNGQLQGTQPVAAMFHAGGPVTIGRGKWTGVQVDWVDGKVDDAQVWDRVLADTEVKALAMPQAPGIAMSANPVTAGANVQATFTAVGGDTNVVRYEYQVDGGPVLTATPPAPGGPATITVTAPVVGTHKVVGWTVDGTGNKSLLNRADFRVREAPKLSGLVTDATTGAAKAGVTVTVSPGDLTAVTGQDGRYEIANLAAGRYMVSATIGGKRCGLFAGTEVDAQQPVTVDLALRPQADAFGYTCTEEVRPFVEGDVANIVDLTGDDVTKPLALPFAFPFYGQSHTTAYLSSNGVVAFEPITVMDSENHPVPSTVKPDAAIYPYWTDLQHTPFPNSSVITKQITENGVRGLIIHYHGMRVYGQPVRVGFSVTLYENGKIAVNYTKLDPASELERGNTATVGIEGPGGTSGLMYSHNEAVLVDDHAIVFHPPVS